MISAHTRRSWSQYAQVQLEKTLGPLYREQNLSADFQIDAELLLQYVLKCSRAALYAWPEKPLQSEEVDLLESILNRRTQGEPLAYILGQSEFYGRDFLINNDVLIPRDDTEVLVRLALEFIASWPDSERQPTVLDIGTGSGIVGITIAAQSGIHLFASDVSSASLAVASSNSNKHAAELVSFFQADWLSCIRDHSVDLIISNPPYIAEHDAHLSLLTHEPQQALVSGAQGLHAIKSIVHETLRVGANGCTLMLEHGYQQANQVQAIMHESGFDNIRSEYDLAGHERVTLGRLAI